MKKVISNSGFLRGQDGFRFLEKLHNQLTHEPTKEEKKKLEKEKKQIQESYEYFKSIATFPL